MPIAARKALAPLLEYIGLNIAVPGGHSSEHALVVLHSSSTNALVFRGEFCRFDRIS